MKHSHEISALSELSDDESESEQPINRMADMSRTLGSQSYSIDDTARVIDFDQSMSDVVRAKTKKRGGLVFQHYPKI